MISLKNYRILSYILLALVVIITIAITNVLLNLIVSGKLGGQVIIFIILNLLINFTLFYMVFRITQQLTEKDTALKELQEKIHASRETMDEKIESDEVKKIDIEDLIQKIIPPSPQSLGIEKFSETILANIAKVSELVQGVFYLKNKGEVEFKPVGKFAYFSNQPPPTFVEGVTLPGQVAKDKKILNINNIPTDYFTVVSGLGSSLPKNLLIVPIPEKEGTVAILELATFKAYDKDFEQLFEKLAILLGKIINKIK
jgi:hypothetical protein